MIRTGANEEKFLALPTFSLPEADSQLGGIKPPAQRHYTANTKCTKVHNIMEGIRSSFILSPRGQEKDSIARIRVNTISQEAKPIIIIRVVKDKRLKISDKCRKEVPPVAKKIMCASKIFEILATPPRKGSKIKY